ncbi:GDSL-type esterase/lipase family protein [Amnibacterium endophyticum]|uniref:GDSL-type esterase/lipase family protein n=1 Tax=Amnibacterium endophyticum TaxID=2109337 RepID=A0ABW4LI04_9MICO
MTREGKAGDRLLRVLLRAWYVRRLRALQNVPAPEAAALRRAAEGDADRVLLIGNGFAHGWGTRSHGLALPGQLEAGLARRSGRRTVVEFVGAEIMNLAAVVPWIREHPLGEYDLILLVLSLNDALRLTSVQDYEAQMRRLVDELRTRRRPGARVVVAGIHPVHDLQGYGGLIGRLTQRRVEELNAAVASVLTGLDGIEFMELPAPVPEPGRPHGSPSMYAEWSAAFSETCGRHLDASVTTRAATARAVTGHAWDWAPGQRLAEDVDGTLQTELQDLASRAKDEFKVDLAYVTLVDGGRQFYLANTAKGGAAEVPLELSHCRETVRGTGEFVVTNSFHDPRFRDSPLIEVPQFRFYAGFPLVSADGATIGTFCVSSVLPHRRGYVPSDQLRAYATLAEGAIQRAVEDQHDASSPVPAEV